MLSVEQDEQDGNISDACIYALKRDYAIETASANNLIIKDHEQKHIYSAH